MTKSESNLLPRVSVASFASTRWVPRIACTIYDRTCRDQARLFRYRSLLFSFRSSGHPRTREPTYFLVISGRVRLPRARHATNPRASFATRHAHAPSVKRRRVDRRQGASVSRLSDFFRDSLNHHDRGLVRRAPIDQTFPETAADSCRTMYRNDTYIANHFLMKTIRLEFLIFLGTNNRTGNWI